MYDIPLRITAFTRERENNIVVPGDVIDGFKIWQQPEAESAKFDEHLHLTTPISQWGPISDDLIVPEHWNLPNISWHMSVVDDGSFRVMGSVLLNSTTCGQNVHVIFLKQGE